MNLAGEKNHFKCSRTTSTMSMMLSRFQVSISYVLKKKLERNQLRFSKLKILLYDYLLLLYMSLYLTVQFVAHFTWFILLSLNLKLTIFLLIGYYSWISYDSSTLNKESRRSYWLKNLPIYNFIRDYFPLRLVKTAELPAGKPYILALFPHGVIPLGVMYNIGTNINKFSELYPGIDIRGVIMNIFFYVPFIREFLIALGSCTCNKENIKYLLESDPPKSVGLSPGGFKEMTLSCPGSKYLIVKENRKGFVKIALETGSSLVPVFSFGDQNLYEQVNINPTHPISKFLIDLIYKITRGRPIFFNGRGIFQEKFGLLPRRHPVTTVIGKPIPVPKVENPSPALIDEYHERFHEALRNLFEENKRMYDEYGDEATLETI